MIETAPDKRLPLSPGLPVDARDLGALDWNQALIFRDRRQDYSEKRFIAILPLRSRLQVAVYTEQRGAQRLISVRKANAREIALYESKIPQA